MKLAIFGATGRTGLPLVEQALAAGHEVKALVRTPSKLTLTHPKLTVIQGDVCDANKVEQTIEGTDAVLSVLGYTSGTQKDMHTAAAKNMINAMKKHGVRRLISLTGLGISHPKDRPQLSHKMIGFIFNTLSKTMVKDTVEHGRLIQESGLDWTILRVPRLMDGAYTGKFQIGYVGNGTGNMINRTDVAAFMLKLATENSYIHDLPMVSN